MSLAAEGGSDARGADGGESGEAGDREGGATEGNSKQEHHLDRSPLELSKSKIHFTIKSDRSGNTIVIVRLVLQNERCSLQDFKCRYMYICYFVRCMIQPGIWFEDITIFADVY